MQSLGKIEYMIAGGLSGKLASSAAWFYHRQTTRFKNQWLEAGPLAPSFEVEAREEDFPARRLRSSDLFRLIRHASYPVMVDELLPLVAYPQGTAPDWNVATEKGEQFSTMTATKLQGMLSRLTHGRSHDNI